MKCLILSEVKCCVKVGLIEIKIKKVYIVANILQTLFVCKSIIPGIRLTLTCYTKTAVLPDRKLQKNTSKKGLS